MAERPTYFAASGHRQGIRAGVNQRNGGNKAEDEEAPHGGGAEWQSGPGFDNGARHTVLFDQIWNVDGGGAEWQSGPGFDNGARHTVLFDQIWNVDNVFIYQQQSVTTEYSPQDPG